MQHPIFKRVTEGLTDSKKINTIKKKKADHSAFFKVMV